MNSEQVKSSLNILPAIRVGVLGFGGLGQAAAKVLAGKREMILVAAADKEGYAYTNEGLNAQNCITAYNSQGSVGYLEPSGTLTSRSTQDLIESAVKITGRTFEGKISTHTFILGDETSMAANVCKPAFDYLKAGMQLHQRGIYGIFTAAEIMPLFVK